MKFLRLSRNFWYSEDSQPWMIQHSPAVNSVSNLLEYRRHVDPPRTEIRNSDSK